MNVQNAARDSLGEFARKFAHYYDGVLFGDIIFGFVIVNFILEYRDLKLRKFFLIL